MYRPTSIFYILAEVDTRSTLVELVRRLPEPLRNRCRKKAVQDRDENGSYPTIKTFLQFLEGVCRELNDPMFGDFTVAASTETKRKPDKKKGQNKQGKSMSFAVESVDKPATSDVKKDICLNCGNDHALYKCDGFKKMAPIKRLKFARDKNLCFNCLRPAKHSATTCHLDHLKCRAEGCNVKHSSLLHDGFAELQKMKATADDDSMQPLTVNNNAVVSDVISANASSTTRLHSAGLLCQSSGSRLLRLMIYLWTRMLCSTQAAIVRSVCRLF